MQQKKALIILFINYLNYFCMKKDNLKGILNPMSDNEKKLVKGGSVTEMQAPGSPLADGLDAGIKSCGEPDKGTDYCKGKVAGQWCVTNAGLFGVCKGWPAIPPCLICFTG